MAFENLRTIVITAIPKPRSHEKVPQDCAGRCFSATNRELCCAMLASGFRKLTVDSGFEDIKGDYMPARSIRVLVVEDFEPFRRFVASILQKRPELQIICEVSDGLEAVQKAEELQPDLVLLDIGLPSLNRIEAARRICKVSPQSKILFLSDNRSGDIAEEGLRVGAGGYVVKSDAAGELLPAVEAVLKGKRFVSASLAGNCLSDPKDEHTAEHNRGGVVPPFPAQNVRIARRHEAGFYSDDRFVLDDLTQFIGAALKAGNAAIVVATKSRRDSLLPRLQAYGLDIGAAIEQGRYVALDAADALPTFMLRGMPDPVRFLKVLGNLIATAAEAAKGEQARVAIFGEMCHLLWAQGNAEAAIQVEALGNQLVKTYDVDILCGYSLGSVQGGMESHIFQRICAEHSAVYSR
jgi:DNA-binding NarL/FixJ family response regulator